MPDKNANTGQDAPQVEAVDSPEVDAPEVVPIVEVAPAAENIAETAQVSPAEAEAIPVATPSVLDADSASNAFVDGATFVGVGHKVTLTAPLADSYDWRRSDTDTNERDEMYFRNAPFFEVSFNLPGDYSYKVNGVTEFKINVR